MKDLIFMKNIDKVRADFPILEQKIYGKPLIYFDNAATTLKPKVVAERIYNHYLMEASNVHRGLHFLSDQATDNFEASRRKIQKFLDAKDESEIVFTKGTTDSINLVARSFGKIFCKPGDEILVSEIEHHSNIVPWQLLAEEIGAKVTSFKVDEKAGVDLEDFKKKLTPKVKIVSFAHVSNSLGIIFPVKELTELAHKNNSVVVVDGAQAVAHQAVSVQDLDCDFYVFSAHKIFGPTGMGVLYGKAKYLEMMPPIDGGGGMIDEVRIEKTTFLKAPFRFEAGTPNIAGVIGLGAAIDYISEFLMRDIFVYEQELTAYAHKLLKDVPGVKVFSDLNKKGPIISFVVEGLHHTDVGSLLDQEGIAVRCGHHCTQPLMRNLKVPGTIRISFSIYNTKEEIDSFVKSLNKVIQILKG
ncbi:MAG: SufS family cysteine desulfurase [Bdellovibrionota bacterium]